MNDDGASGRSVLGTVGRGVKVVLSLPVLAFVVGLPALFFGIVWFLLFAFVEAQFGLPVVTLGLAAAVGVQPVQNGVPVLYPAVLGLGSALVLVASSDGSGSGSVGGSRSHTLGGGGDRGGGGPD
ncbi:hypothetical protein ACFQL1_14845 [Halomicroarcula sp. GCM10025709]|uniref:hypothetical protein n=1 Tax=Haloarcula TaxID=2237 RepID=UPI0024C3E017|nr:hypothetical protein [Halomicroarcula sp. YJ-61-S]